MDITFFVEENKNIYLGTLKVFGLSEKIKVGGVPVLQPGFDYRAEVLNEQEEALHEFQQRFPDADGEVTIQPMLMHRHTNIEPQEENQ